MDIQTIRCKLDMTVDNSCMLDYNSIKQNPTET